MSRGSPLSCCPGFSRCLHVPSGPAGFLPVAVPLHPPIQASAVVSLAASAHEAVTAALAVLPADENKAVLLQLLSSPGSP